MSNWPRTGGMTVAALRAVWSVASAQDDPCLASGRSPTRASASATSSRPLLASSSKN